MNLNELKIATTHFANDYEELQYVANVIISNVSNEVLRESLLRDVRLQFVSRCDDLIGKVSELQLVKEFDNF